MSIMSEERKRAGAGFWITVALVGVLVAYPLSIGPAIWLSLVLGEPNWLSAANGYVYAPLEWLMNHSPDWLGGLIYKYIAFWYYIAGQRPPH
jgi:hypothetical protein